MTILVLWLFTIIVSLGMELSNGLRLFKDVADAGYKIDITRISELSEEFAPDVLKTTFIERFIPVYNIFKQFQIRLQYDNTKYLMVDQLRTVDCLVEMTEEEREEYLKNPTGLNILFIHIKSEDAKCSDVSYEKDDTTILKRRDSLSELSIEEPLVQEFKKENSISKNDELISNTLVNISNQKQELDSLKNELLEQKDIQFTKENENATLSKKIH